ncbi:hypothetical protein G9C98_000460 [Cotesia typhae]|uniref:TraB domain-containing protein n=1 Tax=Cotesia typhae TaxID=2053667 RepID=A0A8J5QUU7_9HYME|nr:hypothetical protein G9C98_000460 [Cotesia typhae]
MEHNDPKKGLIGGQGVQQMHMSIIKPQPDPNESPIVQNKNTTPKSVEIKDKKIYSDPDKDSVIDIDEATNGTESDTEDSSNTNEHFVVTRPFGHNLECDPTIDDRLPETVTLLTTPEGGKVYLVGTAHFSAESQNDVSMIIQAVQPHVVMVELCDARVHILQLDEQTILKEVESLNMLQLGDRPINITLKRALASLSWWQTLTLFWNLLRSKEPISKEDVERCKRRDLLEELLAEMTAEYPPLGQVFVNERDKYLAHSLQLSVRPFQTSQGIKNSRVVGVVGIGHMPGIIKYWGKVQSSEILPLMEIPPQSLSSKILRVTFKVSVVGAIIYVGYKFIPMPSVPSFQSFKSSVQGLFKVSANR